MAMSFVAKRLVDKNKHTSEQFTWRIQRDRYEKKGEKQKLEVKKLLMDFYI